MNVVSHDPRTGRSLAVVAETSAQELAAICTSASRAAPALARTSPRDLRLRLRLLADALETHRDELVDLADSETALGDARLSGEVARTAGQLRFYGEVAAEGSYLGLTIDPASADAPELVRLNRPVGPVAVFGASNFPFAFGVLGNDTGAALAAGCPVIVKAHPAHVGLSVRLAEIARTALQAAGAPAGTFDIVVGQDAGRDLVTAPDVAAVAFTGSQSGGLALWRLANERQQVIPVFAEMGTVNPAVVTRAGAGAIASVAAGFVGSFTLGHGQFCTKPGILFVPAGHDGGAEVARAMRAAEPAPVMLTEAIAGSVTTGVVELENAGAVVLDRVEPPASGWAAPAVVLRAPLESLAAGSRLLEECFGPVAVVCEYRADDDLDRALRSLQPALAASVITAGPRDEQAAGLIDLLSTRVGRVAVDAWPTGVAFTWAQHHGGPWPATSNPSATSVGAAGLSRFVRPVAYQSTPDAWLPSAARAENPWGLPRRVGGQMRLVAPS